MISRKIRLNILKGIIEIIKITKLDRRASSPTEEKLLSWFNNANNKKAAKKMISQKSIFTFRIIPNTNNINRNGNKSRLSPYVS